MLDPDVVLTLTGRYGHLHPLLVHRSVERARTVGELFDLLDTCPPGSPVVWDHAARRWVLTDDILQLENFQITG